jgi:predicted amidophosphoribosyltransferase
MNKGKKGEGHTVAPSRDLASPRDPRALAKLAKAAARVQRDTRKSERVRRRASILHWLEESVFGYRMPLASKLIADAEWTRDGLGAFCGRCGVTRAPFEDVSRGCAECRDRSMTVRGIRMHGVMRLGRYAPPLSQWVPAIKQRAWRDMGVNLGRELGMQVADAIGSGLVPRPHVVVPVPVHWTRRMLRGIDHTLTIAEEAARILAVPIAHPLRARLATRQTGAERQGRLGNRGRFQPRAGQLPPNCTEVLVIDDVRTTGSTTLEVLRVLRTVGVEGVSIGVCAVSDPPRRSGSGFGQARGSRKCG